MRGGGERGGGRAYLHFDTISGLTRPADDGRDDSSLDFKSDLHVLTLDRFSRDHPVS